MLIHDVPALLTGVVGWHLAFCAAAHLPLPVQSRASRARAVSTLYGALVLLASVLCASAVDASAMGKSLFTAAASYYLWALAHAVWERSANNLAMMHHFCCFLCYSFGSEDTLYPVLARAGHLFLLAEVSTTCANLRWFALQAKRPAVAKKCEACFVMSFVGTRLVVGVPLSVSWWLHDLPRIAVPAVAVFYMAANVVWNALNLWTAFQWQRRLQRDAKAATSAAAGGRAINKEDKGTHSSSAVSLSCSSQCIDDDAQIACQLTVSSALDCHLYLWLGAHLDAMRLPEGRVEKKEAFRALQRKFVTRIHGKWYNMQDFKHPGGPVALSLAAGRDATALFESHHPFTSRARLEQVLCKYEIPADRLEETDARVACALGEEEDGGHYLWGEQDAFERELKEKVAFSLLSSKHT
jgi:cytochrome b involved in lipid metabolism